MKLNSIMKSSIFAIGKVLALLLFFILVAPCDSFALGQQRYVEEVPAQGSFPIVQGKVAATIYVDAGDYAGVVRAADDLKADMERVSGLSPAISHDEKTPWKNVIIIGTIGKSRLVDQLIHDGKVDATGITGRWESFMIQVVPGPVPGVASALVICGSDKRGTIYGIYDLSEQIGVSPWYFWADVPPKHHDELFV